MRVYTVTEFRQEMNQLFGQVTVAIQGEVTEFRVSQNRFVWFTLADEETRVQCFMMSFALRVKIEDGMEIRVVGSPTMFKKGQLVFQPRQIELVGDGALRKAFEHLRAQLEREGLFDPQRKRPLPRFSRRIGLVTSRDAAAYTDVLRILRNRWPLVQVVHAQVTVQGPQAGASIVGALQQLNEECPDLDALILTRGGGSLEDLQAFNSEEVVRAVFASRIPVVCGVGHERDISLADLVADVRASTPSNAAELVGPDRRDVRTELDHMMGRCVLHLDATVQRRSMRLTEAVAVLEGGVRRQHFRFVDLRHRLAIALRSHTERVVSLSDQVQRTTQLLASFHPQHVLNRGYSLTRDASGCVLREAGQVKTGEVLTTTLRRGTVTSTVRPNAD